MERVELAWPYPRVRFLSVFWQPLSRLLMVHITFWINVYSVTKVFSFCSVLGERLSGFRKGKGKKKKKRKGKGSFSNLLSEATVVGTLKQN